MTGEGIAREQAFTLIELSIVLVILGLIVGGILVGQDLIKSAAVRAQITQIEKYNQAVNTFKGKFGALPGDMPAATANQFGFAARGLGEGQGDGNGVIEGLWGCGWTTNYGIGEATGETVTFWVDLSGAAGGNLINGTFTVGSETAIPPQVTLTSTPNVAAFFPDARIGGGNYVYVYSSGGINYFGLSAVTGSNCYELSSGSTIPVLSAYRMDTKIDDGLPTTGAVLAQYLNSGISTTSVVSAPNAASDNTTTCYNTTSNTYSISSYANYGADGNCALSFRFQ